MWSEKLIQKLRNTEYRSVFVESSIKSILARQIRILREDHGLSQADLADKLGTKQSTVSRLENPENASVTLNTLLKIASIFDVALKVEFTSHEEFLNRVSCMDRSDFCVLPYDENRISENNALNKLTYWNAEDRISPASTSTPLLETKGDSTIYMFVSNSKTPQTRGEPIGWTSDNRRAEFRKGKDGTPWNVAEKNLIECDK